MTGTGLKVLGKSKVCLILDLKGFFFLFLIDVFTEKWKSLRKDLINFQSRLKYRKGISIMQFLKFKTSDKKFNLKKWPLQKFRYNFVQEIQITWHKRDLYEFYNQNMFCRHAVFGLKLDVKKASVLSWFYKKTFKNANIVSSMQKKCFKLIFKITTQTWKAV